MKKRKLHTVVISDLHLGTEKCCAGELLSYLNSINPKKLILNGDIIDFSQSEEKYFPKSHVDVIKRILDLSVKGTEVFYLTGTVDNIFGRFTHFNLGNIKIRKELTLELDGKKSWFFHGNTSYFYPKIATRFGKPGVFLQLVFTKLSSFTRPSDKKDKVHNSFLHSHNFEKTISDLAIANGYKYVACGFLREPQIIRKVNDKGTCLYLNSGDWVKSLTALEYRNKRWEIYNFKNDKLSPFYSDQELKSMNYNELLASIMISGKSINLNKPRL